MGWNLYVYREDCFASRCVHEWVDLYTEVEDTDVSDLISTPFGGRYCGKIPPRRRISLYGGIAIGFYSDKNTTEEGIFKGTFAFINEGMQKFPLEGTNVTCRSSCCRTVVVNNSSMCSDTDDGNWLANIVYRSICGGNTRSSYNL